MIVVDLENNVLGSAPEITRVNVSGEEGLIKVNMNPEQEFGFFYIGTQDRDLYTIYEDTDVPDINKVWKVFVIDGDYVYEEVPVEPSQFLSL